MHLVSAHCGVCAHRVAHRYIYCLTCPIYILKYIPRVRLIFTLRNPLVRAYSEYLNKVVDKTVMRYLHKRINNKMDKERPRPTRALHAHMFAPMMPVVRTPHIAAYIWWHACTQELSDHAPPFARLVDDVARTMETCGEPNRTWCTATPCTFPSVHC